MPALSKRTQMLLWIAAAVIATACLAAVLRWEFQPETPRRAAYINGSPARGEALFFGEKRCGICHSINGSGGRIAPDLSGRRPTAPAVGWLTIVLWNHQPGMWRQMRGGKTSYPRLSQEEMADILAFLYQASNADSAGDTGAGQKVFTEKGCARCHSVRSSGGKTAPDLSGVAGSGGSSEWARAMWNHAQSMIGPIMGEFGKWPEFSGSEMNNLIAFASAGSTVAGARKPELHANSERGWRVFQKSCIECHSVRGQGGAVGPALGPEKDLPLSAAQFSSLMWNHAPAMLRQVRDKNAALPTLQGDEIADLLAFLASLRYFEPTGSPLLGERLFTQRGCAQCHGAQAEGTRHAGGLKVRGTPYTAVSLATGLWAHGPKMQARAEELNLAWPVLQPADIGELISFLNTPPVQ
jgi:mono/diheme cytochrome c family protein